MPSSDRRSVHPLILAKTEGRIRKPSWLAGAPSVLQSTDFAHSRRDKKRRSAFPILDASSFANSASPIAQSLRAPAVPREVRESGAPRRSRPPTSFRPPSIEDAELVGEMLPPPSIAPSIRPSIQLEVERAALQQAVAASQEERQALEQERRQFAEAAVALAVERARVAHVMEGELIDLSVLVAEAIIGTVDDDDLPVRIAREALGMLPQCSKVTLRAGAGAFESILANFGESFTRDGVVIRVVAAPELEGPGCILEAPEARVDARIRERLEMAARAMHEARAAKEDK